MAAANRVYPVVVRVDRTRRLSMTAAKLWKGWMLMHDDSDSDALAEAGDAAATDKFAGFGLETVDNSGGSTGDLFMTVARAGLAWVEGSATVAAFGWLGKVVYMVDGDTVGQDSVTGGGGAATNDLPVGRMVEYANTGDPLGRTNAVLVYFDADDVRVS